MSLRFQHIAFLRLKQRHGCVVRSSGEAFDSVGCGACSLA